MYSQNLNGKWSVSQSDGKLSVPASVPGCIHTDLLSAGIIKDPFYRTQEFDAYWVAEKEWEYSRNFEVSRKLLDHDEVVLRCHGLDTLATIRINGKPVGQSDNMFRTYEFDAKPLLKSGTNTIEIKFARALDYTNQRQKERHLPGWNKEKLGRLGYIRKEACNFGWDWGIRTVTCGIWRDIELVGYSVARLADVRVDQEHRSAKRVDLNLKMKIEKKSKSAIAGAVVIRRSGKVVANGVVAIKGGAGSSSVSVTNPELWWPNTMGDQPLYEVTVTLADADGHELDSWTRKIGLRTLVLDTHKDEWGESFQFVVNGVPFFAKGGNWIPSDAFANRVTPERYRDLIQSSAQANMNMIRVWGGGIYEEDVFYDLCDEYGICIWQDFMFSCFAYPTYDAEFMENVEQEAVDNISRLRHHPCMALWCGNNELEQGLVAAEWTEDAMSWEDYGKLFDKLLPKLVKKHAGATNYWPGSPHTPLGDRYNHRDPTCGDAHLWDVWHGMQPFEWYRGCEHRFNSEFGFQSFPEPKTTNGYTSIEDRNVTSYVMEHHQRSGIGNTTIMHYMLDWFRLPVGFDQTLWASQILQGMAMKYAVEHWRRSMPRGMGTLYWQINDTWPVASWSSIDYHHRWKALHYMAKGFFAPLLISGVEDTEKGSVEVHLTNDGLASQSLKLKWFVTTAAGKKLESGEKSVKSGKNGSRKVHTLQLAKIISANSDRNVIVWLELHNARKKVAENLVTFARPKHLELAGEPGIVAAVKQAGRKSFTVTLKCSSAALWSWIELSKADFRADANFVHLRPGTATTLKVTPSKEMTVTEFKKQLVVRSLVDLSREG